MTDPTAAEAEAEAEAVRAAAEQHAAVAEARTAAAEHDRDAAAVGAARSGADARIAAAEAARDIAITQACAEGGQRADAAEAARLAEQYADRAQAAAQAARAETGRVRADADKMLASFRAEAAWDRDELRTDLRARAERAERQADAYRDELDQLRSQARNDAVAAAASRTPVARQAGYPAVTSPVRPVGMHSGKPAAATAQASQP